MDPKFVFQSLNTPGSEVAPRSRVVREDFQSYVIRHFVIIAVVPVFFKIHLFYLFTVHLTIKLPTRFLKR